jgi:hypothetical protein
MEYGKNGPCDFQQAYTIKQFCAAHSISRAHLYNLLRIKQGPSLMRVGKRVLITCEAAQLWRGQMQAGNSDGQKS